MKYPKKFKRPPQNEVYIYSLDSNTRHTGMRDTVSFQGSQICHFYITKSNYDHAIMGCYDDFFTFTYLRTHLHWAYNVYTPLSRSLGYSWLHLNFPHFKIKSMQNFKHLKFSTKINTFKIFHPQKPKMMKKWVWKVS